MRPPRPYKSLMDRILANTRAVPTMTYRGTPCLLWTGGLNIDNYAHMTMRVDGKHKRVLVHRVACELEHGSPPPDKPLALHWCNFAGCVNGKHLHWGTNSENLKYFHATHGALGGDEAFRPPPPEAGDAW